MALLEFQLVSHTAVWQFHMRPTFANVTSQNIGYSCSPNRHAILGCQLSRPLMDGMYQVLCPLIYNWQSSDFLLISYSSTSQPGTLLKTKKKMIDQHMARSSCGMIIIPAESYIGRPADLRWFLTFKVIRLDIWTFQTKFAKRAISYSERLLL